VNAFAQENGNRDENGNVVRGPYETNAFGDNWFVGAGIGGNSTWNWQNKGRIPFVTVPGLAVDVYAGKWITPEFGFRLGYYGLTNDSGLTTSPFHYGIFDTFQNTFAMDLLWNASSSIDGYQETRNWSWIPYLRGALELYARDFDGDGARELRRMWGAGAGVLVKKYINDKWSFMIDNRFLVVKNAETLNQTVSGIGNFAFPFALTFGAAYNIGKSGFQRHSSVVPAIIPVPFTTEQYEDLSGKVAELEKENAELKDKIAALENEVAPLRQLVNGQTYLYDNGTFTAVDAAAGAPVTLYFDCGSTTLSAREKAHFEYFAKNVVNENTKLSVNGYADKQTGSAKRNQQLSEQRVKTVVDLLKKAGAAEENIESAAHGATVQLFDGAAKNRVVTVELQ
jgi:outer membrane protein OmpA-like peptidoglycan-associated protein